MKGIYDVALSNGRRVDPKSGRAPRVRSTVDLLNASYANDVGDPQLTAFWTDPDFDPNIRAFYYVRVLEIPKPRWTAYDAKYFKRAMAANIPMTVQDRAYSSSLCCRTRKLTKAAPMNGVIRVCIFASPKASGCASEGSRSRHSWWSASASSRPTDCQALQQVWRKLAS